MRVTGCFPKADVSKIVWRRDILQETWTCTYGVETLFQKIWCQWSGRNEVIKLIQKEWYNEGDKRTTLTLLQILQTLVKLAPTLWLQDVCRLCYKYLKCSFSVLPSLTSLSIHFLICKLGIIIPTLNVLKKINQAAKGPRSEPDT